MERSMPIAKNRLDRIIDSVEKALDAVGKKYVDSDDCDYAALKEQLSPLKPRPSSDGSPENIHGEGNKRSLF
jgi:hypothetical protein